MNIAFVVENNGKIIRKVIASHIEKIPVLNDQKLIVNPKDAHNISSQTHYYDQNKQKFIEYSKEEKETKQFQTLKYQKPVFSGNETDSEINEKINETYMGKINIKSWKAENYIWLRKKFYPSVDMFIEAYITERTTGDSTKMDIFIQAYNNVNMRFPSPVKMEI